MVPQWYRQQDSVDLLLTLYSVVYFPMSALDIMLYLYTIFTYCCTLFNYAQKNAKASLAIAKRCFYASMLSICSSVRLSPKSVYKHAIFSKTKQFRAMVSIDDLYPTWGFQRTHYWTPKILDGRDSASWKSWFGQISTKNHLILMKFGMQMQIWNSVTFM